MKKFNFYCAYIPEMKKLNALSFKKRGFTYGSDTAVTM